MGFHRLNPDFSLTHLNTAVDVELINPVNGTRNIEYHIAQRHILVYILKFNVYVEFQFVGLSQIHDRR